MRIADRRRTVALAARLLAGRHFWLAAFVPLAWSLFLALMLKLGGRQEAFEPKDAQNLLIGMPMAVLAVFLGVRVIAGEIDARRLEIAYTVPGGSQRVWIAKLTAAWGILIASEVLMAAFTYAFFTSFPPGSLYGAFQAASFYLVLSMGLATLFKSEVSGAMVSVLVLAVGWVISASRFSPFWDPLALAPGTDASRILGWAVQNRIGFLLAMAALVGLAFGRAERREQMLAG